VNEGPNEESGTTIEVTPRKVLRPGGERLFFDSSSEISVANPLPYEASRIYEIILFGENDGVASPFGKKLLNAIYYDYDGNDETVVSYHQGLLLMLDKLAATFFPDKFFWSPLPGVYELRSKEYEVAQRKRMVELAQFSGAPLEFGYDSRRGYSELKRGRDAPRPEPVERTHRANVLAVDDVSFTTQHERGVRRYNFSKLRWAVAEGHKADLVIYEPRFTLRLQPELDGSHTVAIKRDRVRSRDE
jgi:hypothetical protein